MDKKQYKNHTKKTARSSPIVKDSFIAFGVGGLISLFGQVLFTVYSGFLSEKESAALVSTTLIFIAVLLTGIGIFDKIASFAGAGTLVPITGFANAVSSAAIDSRSEGYVLGVGAKIFTIAGPVILYGTAAGIIYGIAYWLCLIM